MTRLSPRQTNSKAAARARFGAAARELCRRALSAGKGALRAGQISRSGEGLQARAANLREGPAERRIEPRSREDAQRPRSRLRARGPLCRGGSRPEARLERRRKLSRRPISWSSAMRSKTWATPTTAKAAMPRRRTITSAPWRSARRTSGDTARRAVSQTLNLISNVYMRTGPLRRCRAAAQARDRNSGEDCRARASRCRKEPHQSRRALPPHRPVCEIRAAATPRARDPGKSAGNRASPCWRDAQ